MLPVRVQKPLNTRSMDKLLSPPVVWGVLGLILFLAELVLPGLILFFFAVGAWVVALLSLFLDLSVASQLFIFLVASVLSVVFFRRSLSRLLSKKSQGNELIEDEFIGRNAVAETAIRPGLDGKVNFRGVSWSASSADTIEAGEQVLITGNKSIKLIVKSTKVL